MERSRSPGTGLVADRDIPRKTVEIRDKEKMKTIEVPTYDQKGHAVQPLEKAKRKKRTITVSLITGVILFVYAPQFFMDRISDHSENTISVATDLEAIRSSNGILRENSMGDFDGDGVLNADETAAGTDPWRIDTDRDGVTDYAELHITATSPTEWTGILQDIQMKRDKLEDKSLANPYKINDLILWPDSYEAKAYGSVVETLSGGYRFCGFSGSVLFPESTGKTAYRVRDGIHEKLEHDLTDNTWIVHDGDFVVLCDKEYAEFIRLRVFAWTMAVPKNIFTKGLDVLLPQKGFLSSVEITEADVKQEAVSQKVNEIVKPDYKDTDVSRLKCNMTMTESLLAVQEKIDEGRCVAVSLFNSNQGEYIGIIYGYTGDGDFLLADLKDPEEKGIIHITENAQRMLNEEGEIVSVQYFDWDAFGFSSENGDRISFFASSHGSFKE